MRAQRADEHAQIFEAVMARDADRATELLTSHFARSSEKVMVLLEADEKAAAELGDQGPASI